MSEKEDAAVSVREEPEDIAIGVEAMEEKKETSGDPDPEENIFIPADKDVYPARSKFQELKRRPAVYDFNPKVRWEDGGKVEFFKTPSPLSTITGAFFSLGSPASISLTYFIFTMKYANELAWKRRDLGTTTTLFEVGMIIMSVAPLLFCLFLNVLRLELAVREALYYLYLRQSIIVDFENKSFMFSFPFWFLVVQALYVLSFGVYQTYHLSPNDTFFSKFDTNLIIFVVTQTVLYYLYCASMFSVESRLLTVNQVVEWRLMSPAQRMDVLDTIKKKVKERLSARSSSQLEKEVEEEVEGPTSFEFLSECHVINEQHLRWIMKNQILDVLAFNQQFKHETKAFLRTLKSQPKNQRSRLTREFYLNHGLQIDLSPKRILFLANEAKKQDQLFKKSAPFCWRIKNLRLSNYALLWFQHVASRSHAKELPTDDVANIKKKIKRFNLLSFVLVLVIEVYGFYKMDSSIENGGN